MFTIKHYLQYVNNLKIGKRQLSITKEKAEQKSKLSVISCVSSEVLLVRFLVVFENTG